PANEVEYLFAREIHDLKLPGVRLAVLAACDTEVGKTIGGEGVAALSRAFLATGVGATVSTLWRVSDRASGDFLRHFYAALAQGQSSSAALRFAKLQLRRSQSAAAHPRYWAGYILTGSADMQTPRSTQSVAVTASALVFALLAGWLYIRRGGRTQ
ncbi:MAG: CHAT domain-containing protein, partial [Acidobacteria bacterium]|nr:CHAT domain-containing protein [Acidobacteriota bacterium]